jgi:hypothetical protein
MVVFWGRRTEIKRKPCERYWLPSLQRRQFCWQARRLGKPMPKPRAERRISPRNHKISRLFNEQPAEDRDPTARGDLSGAAVRTVVGAHPAGATMVVMAIAGHTGGAGAIVGGKSEPLGVREAASVGGLFFYGSVRTYPPDNSVSKAHFSIAAAHKKAAIIYRPARVVARVTVLKWSSHFSHYL